MLAQSRHPRGSKSVDIFWFDAITIPLHGRVILTEIVRDHCRRLQSLKERPKSFREEKIPHGTMMEKTAGDGSTRLPRVKNFRFLKTERQAANDKRHVSVRDRFLKEFSCLLCGQRKVCGRRA